MKFCFLFVLIISSFFILGCFDWFSDSESTTDKVDDIPKVDFDYVCRHGETFGVLSEDGFVSLERKTHINLTKKLYSGDLDALYQISELDCITKLDLSSTKINDLSSIKKFENLKSINLFSTDVEDLSPVKNLVNLEKLNISFTNVSDISSINNLNNLRVLMVDHTKISDFSPIYNLTQLEQVNAWGSKLTRNGCLELKENLPNTKVIC